MGQPPKKKQKQKNGFSPLAPEVKKQQKRRPSLPSPELID